RTSGSSAARLRAPPPPAGKDAEADPDDAADECWLPPFDCAGFAPFAPVPTTLSFKRRPAALMMAESTSFFASAPNDMSTNTGDTAHAIFNSLLASAHWPPASLLASIP